MRTLRRRYGHSSISMAGIREGIREAAGIPLVLAMGATAGMVTGVGPTTGMTVAGVTYYLNEKAKTL